MSEPEASISENLLKIQNRIKTVCESKIKKKFKYI